MRVCSSIVLVLIFCGVWVMGRAQEPSISRTIPYAETTQGMVDNLIAKLNKADASLNEVYGKLLSQLDEAGKTKFRLVEKAWLKYRDAEVAFVGSLYEGGSIRPVMEVGCLLAMTRNRTKELQGVLDDNFGH